MSHSPARGALWLSAAFCTASSATSSPRTFSRPARAPSRCCSAAPCSWRRDWARSMAAAWVRASSSLRARDCASACNSCASCSAGSWVDSCSCSMLRRSLRTASRASWLSSCSMRVRSTWVAWLAVASARMNSSQRCCHCASSCSHWTWPASTTCSSRAASAAWGCRVAISARSAATCASSRSMRAASSASCSPAFARSVRCRSRISRVCCRDCSVRVISAPIPKWRPWTADTASECSWCTARCFSRAASAARWSARAACMAISRSRTALSCTCAPLSRSRIFSASSSASARRSWSLRAW